MHEHYVMSELSFKRTKQIENFRIGLKWMKKQKLDWATSNLESAANINDQINMLNLIKHSSEAFYSLKRANINVEQQSYNSFQ